MTVSEAALRLSSDADEMDVDAIHAYLSGESYWARGIPREVVQRAVRHSLCFGIFDGGAQVAFARLVTDRATYAYVADVYVLQPYRGRGLGKWLMEAAMAHPDVQGLRRWELVTKDAHGLYERFGFAALARPERSMERTFPASRRRLRSETGLLLPFHEEVAETNGEDAEGFLCVLFFLSATSA